MLQSEDEEPHKFIMLENLYLHLIIRQSETEEMRKPMGLLS